MLIMADSELERLLRDLLEAPPLSPTFLASRDRLEQAATLASARLAAAVNRLAVLGEDRAVQAEVAARLGELQRLSDALAGSAAATRPGGWRRLFARRGPDPETQRLSARQQYVATVAELAASRDAMLRQLVALDHGKAMLAEACTAIERARIWLGQAAARVEAVLALADPHRAQALRGEVLPALIGRQAALSTELALGHQARLALTALGENSQALVAAIDHAIRTARSAESADRAIDRADRDLRRTEAELARLAATMEGVAEATGEVHRNLIDPEMASQDGRALDQVGRALANIRHALGALDSERERLVSAAHSIAHSQSRD